MTVVSDSIAASGSKARRKTGDVEDVAGAVNGATVAARRAYYAQNRERILEKRREHYRAHKARLLEYSREYYQQHKEQIRDKSRRWYDENRNRKSEYWREYYLRHRDTVLSRNRERYEARKLARAQARAKELGAQAEGAAGKAPSAVTGPLSGAALN